MKQLDDNMTIEMYPDLIEAVKGANYRFFIGLTDGTEVEWTGLTRKQARDMYAYTNAHHPCNVTGSGWGVTK